MSQLVTFFTSSLKNSNDNTNKFFMMILVAMNNTLKFTNIQHLQINISQIIKIYYQGLLVNVIELPSNLIL